MRTKYLLLLCGVFSLSACATIHPGQMGHSLREANIPLQISAIKVEQEENKAFELIDVTLENTADSWLKINSVRVVIDDPGAKKISVVMGRDLKDWALAMEAKLKQDTYNKNIAMTGLAAVGAVATAYGLSSNNNQVAALGAATLVGAGAWAATDKVKSNYKTATTSQAVPDNHLYQSFSVPPKMYARKWVLLNKPINTTITSLILDVETVEGRKDTYEISL
ncbi:MAG: hypothetical protein KDD37_11075 [Bdellovibrionales bacterium]|nr:hypothetical protein [Bdellovibrionales bacterium]